MDSSRGYLVIAQNTDDVDYVELAYALAMSIKLTQTVVTNICIITDTKLSDKYEAVFDDVVYLNEDDTAKDSEWRIENKWQYYKLSPYDKSMILDVDMIFCSDVSHWWDDCEGHDMVPTLNVNTYRNEQVSSTYYRETFRLNTLQNIYTGAYYFEKNERTEKFFELIKDLFKNWKDVYQVYLPHATPEFVSADVIYAIAWDLFYSKKAPDLFLTFTHMKSMVQHWQRLHNTTTVQWTDYIMWYASDDGSIYIGNWLQSGILHYVQKDFIYQNNYL